MTRLIVKLDPVAELRSARSETYPDPVAAAVAANLAGADGVAVQLYEDQRHVRQEDVRILRHVITHNFWLDIAPTREMLAFALDLRPDAVTLVAEQTREHPEHKGIDLVLYGQEAREAVQTLQNDRIPVGIRIDPDPEQVKLAHQANADRIEMISETFCRAVRNHEETTLRSGILDTVKLALKLRMTVSAGSGLCYSSIQSFKGIGQVDTFVIGHSIISRALLTGMESAVKEMIRLIEGL